MPNYSCDCKLMKAPAIELVESMNAASSWGTLSGACLCIQQNMEMQGRSRRSLWPIDCCRKSRRRQAEAVTGAAAPCRMPSPFTCMCRHSECSSDTITGDYAASPGCHGCAGFWFVPVRQGRRVLRFLAVCCVLWIDTHLHVCTHATQMRTGTQVHRYTCESCCTTSLNSQGSSCWDEIWTAVRPHAHANKHMHARACAHTHT